MNICYITSDAYAPYAGISMVSLFENNMEMKDVIIYIISYDLSDINRSKYNQVANHYGRKIEFIDVNWLLDYLREEYGIKPYNGSSIVYTRMFLDRLLPETVDSILYIDSDTIITGDLSAIEKIDMDNKVMAMAENYILEINPQSLWENEFEVFKKTRKLFNDGVIWFNFANWKKWDINELIDAKLRSGEKFAFAEQSIINCTVPHSLIYTLAPKYNSKLNLNPLIELDSLIEMMSVFCNKDELLESETNPVIVHYVGDFGRPWFKESTSRKKEEYDLYKSLSPWKDLSDLSYFKASRYKNSSFVLKIKLRIAVKFFHSRWLNIYKRMTNKIGKW